VTTSFSKSQIDRLGMRLKSGAETEDDLRNLDQYRRSFGDAYSFVVGAVRTELRLKPTGRSAKSTTSIMQDIAGCRVLTRNLAQQDRTVARLRRLFAAEITIDRRAKPTHGYRAVHVIVPVEAS
jgi:putative GTP pyrophosphokinase